MNKDFPPVVYSDIFAGVITYDKSDIIKYDTCIYRVEDSKGIGVFTSSYTSINLIKLFDDYDDYYKSHPRPESDSKLNNIFSHDYYCACESLENLYSWFPNPVLDLLITEYGCKVIKLYVSECLVGTTQVIYKPEHIISEEIL